jgi:hypothetical protein
MKRIFAFLFLFAALLSCSDDFNKINKNGIIPRDKFIEVIVGVHLMDVMSNGPGFSRKFEPGDSVNINQAVFEKYNITKAEFDSTVAMYTRQPDAYVKVYDEVLLKLNYMLDTLKNNNPQFSKEAPEE